LFANGTNRRRAQAGGDFLTFYSTGADKPSEFFGFTEDKIHQANGTRIAFWADTREEFDRIAELVRQAGGKNPEAPDLYRLQPGLLCVLLRGP